ncbi:MAG TPA: D-tyrosyl-tRNA(Tyr) deacylase [Clostridiales bacterium]|nr:D-tyrosyl-tRNA(Tyr) deacylase [Clostridiales bacterium]
MKLVVQRVKSTRLEVDGKLVSEIGKGLAVYVGVAVGDSEKDADRLAEKLVKLRIFEDENGKMNLSVSDIGGEILSISQFTLLADVSHGNRPGFSGAERPERANELYEYFCAKVASLGVPVKKGVFGADMQIMQHNDGPVTIIYEGI